MPARKLRATRVAGIRILAGVEVDILRDGALDLEPQTLTELDLVVASVHSYLNLERGDILNTRPVGELLRWRGRD